jgi:hypothetical protein
MDQMFRFIEPAQGSLDPDELFPDTVKDSDQIRTGFLIHGCRLPEAYILFSDLHAAAGRDLHPIVLLLRRLMPSLSGC